MTDREKVIEDFERYYEQLFEDERRLGEHGVIMKSPEERLGRIEIVGKALALLKAQEPRVTREEAECASNQDWSGAQGNDSERIKEQAERSYCGIFG